MTNVSQPSGPEAAKIAARFKEGLVPAFPDYVAVQLWATAAEQAATTKAAQVANALRTHTFESVLGRIGFDGKGDVTGYASFVWYVWQGGDWAPKGAVN
jgi:branched-chain amino acid transport system substrate-binding protein